MATNTTITTVSGRGGRIAFLPFLPARLRALLLLAPLLAALSACGSRTDLRPVDDCGQELAALMGQAVTAMGEGHSDALRGCRQDLVRLRLRASGLAATGRAGELRDTLLVAIDAVADALAATAAGLEAQSAAEAGADPESGAELLREATAHLELGEARLSAALATVQRFRARREGAGGAR